MTDSRDGGYGGGSGDPLDEIDFEEFQLDEPQEYEEVPEYAAYEAPPPALISCPSCGAAQAATNRHCEQCGARLSQSALPVAPRPLGGMNAGTRALTVILSLIAGVVVLAVLWNLVFGGDDNPVADQSPEENGTTNTEETTATTVGPIEEITPIAVRCSSELNDGTLACGNLIDMTEAPWNDASLKGEGAQMVFTFAEPVALAQIHFWNLGDETRFRRNYRVRGIEIQASDLPGLPIPAEIEDDNSRQHVVSVSTLATEQVTIQITSTWPSEAIDGKAFDELAIEEIQFWGRRVDSATTDETPSTTDG